MNTVLAAIDFSRVSRKVLATAIQLARGIHGRVVVLNAVQPPAIVAELAPLAGEVVQITDEVERASRRHLQRIQKQLAAGGASVETVCQQGAPVQSITAHAKELGAHYIVLGSHGHNAFYDLVVGSTASGVLKRATCPVVIVPSMPAASVPVSSRRGHTAGENHQLRRPARGRRQTRSEYSREPPNVAK
jgi:nucleotide-binding universal stress UspA family protein